MNVNTNAWEAASQWNDAGSYGTIDEKLKVKKSRAVYDLVSAGKLVVNTPWDNSLSYCGMGSGSAFSNISYIRHWVPYYINDSRREGKVYEELVREENTSESRTVTNFAIGHIEVATGVAPYHITIKGTMNTYPKITRWAPNSNASYTGYSSNRSYCMGGEWVTKLPVKNMVLIPYVHCVDSLDPPYNDVVVDLKTYTDIESDFNINNYPYVLSVMLKFYYSYSNSDFAIHDRRYAFNFDALALFDPSTIYDDMNCDNQNILSPDYVPITNAYVYDRAWYNPRGSISYLPIMGNTYTTSRSPTTRPRFTYTADWVYVYGNDDEPASFNEMESGDFVGAVWLGDDLNTHFVSKQNPSNMYDAVNPDYNYVVCYMAPESAESFRDKVREQVAYFGLFFTDGDEYRDVPLDDEHMMLGTIEDGITNGHYTYGEYNRDEPQWNWDDMHENEYDPTDPLDEHDNPYTATVPKLNPTAHAFGGDFYFSGDDSKLSSLLTELQSLTVPERGWTGVSQFYGQEPLSCIIEARLIFITNPYTTGETAVRLGSYSSNVNMYLRTSTTVQTYNYTPLKVEKKFFDFRDYAPYTTVTLFVPFCGSVELDTNLVMDHMVNIEEQVEPITGDIKCNIYIDTVPFYTLKGNCACDLSISGFNMAQYAQSRATLQMQDMTSRLNAGAALVGGSSGSSIAASLKNPTGAQLQMLGGIVNYANSMQQSLTYKQMNLRLKPSVGRADRASSNVEEGCIFRPYIIINRPRLLKFYEKTGLVEYGKQVGFATHYIGKIGAAKGFIKCENPHVDIECTPEEQKQIASLLESGVRIKR